MNTFHEFLCACLIQYVCVCDCVCAFSCVCTCLQGSKEMFLVRLSFDMLN